MREKEQHCSDCTLRDPTRVKCLSNVRWEEAGKDHDKVLPLYGPNQCTHYYPKPEVRVADALEGFLKLADDMLTALDKKAPVSTPEPAPSPVDIDTTCGHAEPSKASTKRVDQW